MPPRVYLSLTPEENEAVRQVVDLSIKRGFPYSETRALHWLIEQGIQALAQKTDELTDDNPT